MNKQKILLKDKLLTKENIEHLANLIKKTYLKFDKETFKKNILKEFPKLELKERTFWISENIEKQLPKKYEETLDILLKSVKNEPISGNFIFLAFTNYISKNGCNKKDLDKSLNALGEFTKFFSSEMDIRFFINKFPEKTFKKMKEWALDTDVHKRRLASEGLRPKLPWANSIKFDYKRGSEVLNNLFFDKNRYVTRSVANHLNDISKIDLNFVLKTLKRWKSSKKQNEKEMGYIIKHSLRTSIKKGHVKTIDFLGFNSKADIKLKNLKINRKHIKLGEFLEFSFEIFSKSSEKLIIDYKISYPTASNRFSEKVFKIKNIKIKKEEIIKIIKKHPFRKMTTKKLYSGTYKLQIQINGNLMNTASFNLKT